MNEGALQLRQRGERPTPRCSSSSPSARNIGVVTACRGDGKETANWRQHVD